MSVPGKRRGGRTGLPRFTLNRETRRPVRFSKNGFRLRDNGRLHPAKIGDVQVRWSRPLPSAASSVTVIKETSGRFCANVVVEAETEFLEPVADEVGFGVGTTTTPSCAAAR
ncbi:hypothetical protein [Streptomyces sp. NPDC005877]|uniref:hypothetical protein n=1 Tax=Streptomyces sp. NPDC005877 TaxID=3155346 RepID=UPI0033D1706E